MQGTQVDEKVTLQGLIFVLLLAFILPACSQTVHVRPISIQVIDAQSGDPMENIPVYRVFEIWRSHFPYIIDPPNTQRYVVEEYMTDSLGQVANGRLEMQLGKHEWIQHENIMINIDIRDDYVVDDWLMDYYKDLNTKYGRLARLFSIHDFEHVEAFYNPVAEYRGFVAANVDFEWPGDEEQGGTERKKFDVLWNSHSLAKEREEIIIGLRKYDRRENE